MLRDAVSRFLFRLDEEKTRLLARTGDPDKIEFADAVVAFESVKANLSDKARMLGEEGETLMDRIELVEAEAQALEARLKELQEAAEARQAQLAAAAAAAPESNPSATLEAQLGADGIVYRATLVIRAKGNADEDRYIDLLRENPDISVERIV